MIYFGMKKSEKTGAKKKKQGKLVSEWKICYMNRYTASLHDSRERTWSNWTENSGTINVKNNFV